MHHVRIDVAVKLEASRQDFDVPGVGVIGFVVELEQKIEPARSFTIKAEAVAGPVLVRLGVPEKPAASLAGRLVSELLVAGHGLDFGVHLVDVRDDQLVQVMIPELAHLKHPAQRVLVELVVLDDVDVLEELVAQLPRHCEVAWAL